MYYEIAGVRRGKWKLVKLSAKKYELYDLEVDLGEKNDISRQHAEKVRELVSLPVF